MIRCMCLIMITMMIRLMLRLLMDLVIIMVPNGYGYMGIILLLNVILIKD